MWQLASSIQWLVSSHEENYDRIVINVSKTETRYWQYKSLRNLVFAIVIEANVS